MKKIIALMLSMIMVLSMAACSSGNDTAESDMEYVKEKGTLIVGITEYPPMDYEETEGEWIGFDADMAKAFAKNLGVEVEFIEIDWDNKIFELDGKTIDCVWNGMTLVDEVLEGMECTNAYCNNSQVVIVPADKADQFQTVESISDLTFAVEAGSAGQKQAEALELNFTPVKTQADALLEVASGTSDAAIIDALMAGSVVGEGTNYDNLTYTVSLGNEEFGVGFRKGSDLAEALNEFFVTSTKNGSMMKCAEKYGVQAAIIPQE
ncbi:MAG: transporter substrate-binding domain-containing protein [Tyzzerella sp.]|nr:transporter substrate-binding domain-containing protein [Tyzzerella sp.]